ncbi:MAG: PQQ-binding-like beta-propeller repeat protein, partial [Verrucomicrobia subdivision 3 bacterium]|nr:PQQ-binding-like beta-propeller repeat protein [Limisphaerales bacterium]
DGLDEVIVVGSVHTVAYSLTDGKERWRVAGTEGVSVAPSPVMAGERLIVMSRAFGGSRIPTFPEFLTQNDKDGDGKVSRPEAPNYLREHGGFIATDRDKDGHISELEWTGMRDLIGRGEHGIFAVRAPAKDDTGDLTATHVLWKHKKGVADVASPLFYRGRVYVIQNGGRASCYDAKSGQIRYEQERIGVDGGYYASPVAANGHIYYASTSGTICVTEAGDSLNVKARNVLGEPISATPAIAENQLYIRSERHLWAFGRP